MKNWFIRSLTGIVYIAVIVLAILGGWQLVYLLALLLGLPAMWEFKRLCMKGEREAIPIVVADMFGGAMVMLLGTWCIAYALSGLMLYLIVRMILQVYEQDEKPLTSYAGSLASLVYVALPLTAIVIISTVSPYLLLAMFILIWINDTGAFVVGCTIGKHRLFERVSPKKSWEGFFGGLAFAVATSVGMYFFTSFYDAVISSPYVAAIYGAVVTVFATYGDLLESSIKRASGVKDSGHLLPGHGGMLDRIDSLLMVAPASLILLLAITGWLI